MIFLNLCRPVQYLKILKNHFRNRIFRIIYILIIGLNISVSLPIVAQNNDADNSKQNTDAVVAEDVAEDDDEIIVVTGSRIKIHYQQERY